MVRSLIGFFIVAVIFLAGMVVGSGEEDQQSIGESIKMIDFHPDSETHSEETEQLKSKEEQYDTVVNQAEQETPKHFIQIVASSLESVVKGFYDMIVQLCYAFTKLFM